jgi:hypothetical protein
LQSLWLLHGDGAGVGGVSDHATAAGLVLAVRSMREAPSLQPGKRRYYAWEGSHGESVRTLRGRPPLVPRGSKAGDAAEGHCVALRLYPGHCGQQEGYRSCTRAVGTQAMDGFTPYARARRNERCGQAQVVAQPHSNSTICQEGSSSKGFKPSYSKAAVYPKLANGKLRLALLACAAGQRRPSAAEELPRRSTPSTAAACLPAWLLQPASPAQAAAHSPLPPARDMQRHNLGQLSTTSLPGTASACITPASGGRRAQRKGCTVNTCESLVGGTWIEPEAAMHLRSCCEHMHTGRTCSPYPGAGQVPPAPPPCQPSSMQRVNPGLAGGSSPTSWSPDACHSTRLLRTWPRRTSGPGMHVCLSEDGQSLTADGVPVRAIVSILPTWLRPGLAWGQQRCSLSGSLVLFACGGLIHMNMAPPTTVEGGRLQALTDVATAWRGDDASVADIVPTA